MASRPVQLQELHSGRLATEKIIVRRHKYLEDGLGVDMYSVYVYVYVYVYTYRYPSI